MTVHEFAHGFIARRLGDRTAERAGRLTLNPIAHLDPVGSVFLPLVLAFLGGPIFGWAKPVPINPSNFRGDISKGMVAVSLAGPGSNLLLAFAGAVALGVAAAVIAPGSLLIPFLRTLILINLFLAFFNLLPIPPLDGSKVLGGLLPGRQEWLYNLERYGFLLLLALLFFGGINALFVLFIQPVFGFLLNISESIARFFVI